MISRDDQFDGWKDACDGYTHQKQRWQGWWDVTELDAIDKANELKLTISEHAALKTAEQLETISYFLFHLVKFAERRDSRPRIPKRREWTKRGQIK